MSWLTRLRNLFRSDTVSDEIDREMAFHLAERTDDLMATGVPPDAARHEARRRFGSYMLQKENTRDRDLLVWLELLLADLRYGLRLLTRNPTFSLVAILTVALGTGANAAIFQLVNAVRFRPLPVERPHELVSIGIDMHGRGRDGMGYRGRSIYTEPLWQELRAQQQAFSSVIAWGSDSWDLATEGESTPAMGLFVSGGFFETLGVRALVGRAFTDADDRHGCGAPGAVLSHGFWQERYGGDAGVIGRTITLNRRPVDIIGVAPRGFFGVDVGRGFDVAIPLCAEPLLRGERAGTGKHAVWWLDVMGRLRPGWTVPQAQAHVAALSRTVFAATVPPSYSVDRASAYRAWTLTATPAATGVSSVRTQYATHLWLLLGATGVVLLIMCANLANLMLARATARDREIAVRLAIGGSRRRVVRQMLAESVLIAGVGALAGLLLASWLSRALVTLLSTERTTIVLDLMPDWRALVFTTLVAVVACVLFGLSPALRATRAPSGQALRAGSRSGTDAREALGLRRGLVVTQVALSMVLVVVALLFARSLRNLAAVELGFRPDLLAAYVDLRRTAVPPEARPQVLGDILARIRAVPGVRHAAEAFNVPLSNSDWNGRIVVAGAQQDGDVRFNAVGPEYFRALDTPLLAGRMFDARDQREAPKTAVVNPTFVKRYFANRDPIGQDFQMEMPPGRPRPTYHIVGVVRDTKYLQVREDYLPIAYVAVAQEAELQMPVGIVVRADLPPASVTPAMTRAITDAAPGASVSYDTVSQYIGEGLRTDRLMASLSGFFGLLALIIAVVGLYGVMSYVVTRRKVEIGIRMALGADQRTVIRMMLAESGVLLAIGGAIGVLLAVVVSRYTAGLLYGVTALDPTSFALAIGGLGSVSLLAAWIPARRASRVTPSLAIRE